MKATYIASHKYTYTKHEQGKIDVLVNFDGVHTLRHTHTYTHTHTYQHIHVIPPTYTYARRT